jgi:hypothetical protein
MSDVAFAIHALVLVYAFSNTAIVVALLMISWELRKKNKP